MVSPTELSEAIIASLIIAMSLVAGALAAVRRPSGDRAALWFGLFGGLYGVRLAGQSEFVQPFLPEVYWRYLDAFVTYAIVVPGGLFIESVLGPGWRQTLRRTWQAAAVYATLAIVRDLLRRQPGAALWLNPPVVLTAGEPGQFVDHLVAELQRWIGPDTPLQDDVTVVVVAVTA